MGVSSVQMKKYKYLYFATCITEKCRTGPGLEPRVFRLTYDRSTS